MSVLSLLLCMGTVAAWVASCLHPGVLGWGEDVLGWEDGSVVFGRGSISGNQAVFYGLPRGIPLWLISPGFLMVACLFGWAARALPRSEPCNGTCLACGYNLTGNISGICPECGTATAAGAKP